MSAEEVRPHDSQMNGTSGGLDPRPRPDWPFVCTRHFRSQLIQPQRPVPSSLVNGGRHSWMDTAWKGESPRLLNEKCLPLCERARWSACSRSMPGGDCADHGACAKDRSGECQKLATLVRSIPEPSAGTGRKPTSGRERACTCPPPWGAPLKPGLLETAASTFDVCLPGPPGQGRGTSSIGGSVELEPPSRMPPPFRSSEPGQGRIRAGGQRPLTLGCLGLPACRPRASNSTGGRCALLSAPA